MYHNPEETLRVPLQLDKVVAAAECAYLLGGRGILTGYHRELVHIETLWHECRVLGGLVMVEAEGNLLSDAAHELLSEHVPGDILRTEGSLHRAHPAADVHPDSVGDDGAFRCQHAAYGHALAPVHVRHECQVVEDEGEGGKVHYLLHPVRVHMLRPDLYGRSVQLDLIHGLVLLCF